jgi:hypothetical protein
LRAGIAFSGPDSGPGIRALFASVDAGHACLNAQGAKLERQAHEVFPAFG